MSGIIFWTWCIVSALVVLAAQARLLLFLRSPALGQSEDEAGGVSPQEELSAELRDYLYRELGDDRPPGRVRWVMNGEWHAEMRRCTTIAGRSLWLPGIRVSDPEYLFAIPVDIRDDGGVPHLEPAAAPCDYCGRSSAWRSKIDGRWLCGGYRPCWCDYCRGRVNAHGPDAVALYEMQVARCTRCRWRAPAGCCHEAPARLASAVARAASDRHSPRVPGLPSSVVALFVVLRNVRLRR